MSLMLTPVQEQTESLSGHSHSYRLVEGLLPTDGAAKTRAAAEPESSMRKLMGLLKQAEKVQEILSNWQPSSTMPVRKDRLGQDSKQMTSNLHIMMSSLSSESREHKRVKLFVKESESESSLYHCI